ncbi:hypothetical protein PGT21_037261 [Puccinia graminis f. sp. tritici]|uniref:Uncharacterized protein n=2 Tax=Puccinia graminis f. sp. tritici TaxID=56615 RepID=H6QS49_PUCGT|nr:uncharacterized protein PGTG_21696 [Puccinia graminis f. sp. tritici CRL 75-36-700-3]EHS63522.1 hypothetical protein PGTG_21696 [Puccinia graminis f. sp. tritici CRL 75-36-700-3]KAA1114079.1 hypothetical protein PGTUg99_017541 [Puccinia graminis f. sp. tritici]KAA1120204.1 hypothetical protein PGT21_037261 [Puccinia graminis f. sp. tritici]
MRFTISSTGFKLETLLLLSQLLLGISINAAPTKTTDEQSLSTYGMYLPVAPCESPCKLNSGGKKN